MRSDLYIVKVPVDSSTDKTIFDIARAQAQRDEPRKLVSATYAPNTNEMVLFFELIDMKQV